LLKQIAIEIDSYFLGIKPKMSRHEA